jgi:hypothetical protein
MEMQSTAGVRPKQKALLDEEMFFFALRQPPPGPCLQGVQQVYHSGIIEKPGLTVEPSKFLANASLPVEDQAHEWQSACFSIHL